MPHYGFKFNFNRAADLLARNEIECMLFITDCSSVLGNGSESQLICRWNVIPAYDIAYIISLNSY